MLTRPAGSVNGSPGRVDEFCISCVVRLRLRKRLLWKLDADEKLRLAKQGKPSRRNRSKCSTKGGMGRTIGQMEGGGDKAF
jgi:hypothetical protein